MSTTATVVILFVALVVLVVAVIAVMRARERRQLRSTFGDEYDRTLERTGKRRDAERDLSERKAEHDQLQLRDLTPAARARYLERWQQIQARFVDAPVPALAEADTLLSQLLGERGYPSDSDAEQQGRLLSVEHTRVIESFRAGHAIEQANSGSGADTEQVRQGMLHFRTVFEEVLGDSGSTGDVYPDEPQRPDRIDLTDPARDRATGR
jgi:hypothetical protein